MADNNQREEFTRSQLYWVALMGQKDLYTHRLCVASNSPQISNEDKRVIKDKERCLRVIKAKLGKSAAARLEQLAAEDIRSGFDDREWSILAHGSIEELENLAREFGDETIQDDIQDDIQHEADADSPCEELHRYKTVLLDFATQGSSCLEELSSLKELASHLDNDMRSSIVTATIHVLQHLSDLVAALDRDDVEEVFADVRRRSAERGALLQGAAA